MAVFSIASHGCSVSSQTSIGPPMTRRRSNPSRSGISSPSSSSTVVRRIPAPTSKVPSAPGSSAARCWNTRTSPPARRSPSDPISRDVCRVHLPDSALLWPRTRKCDPLTIGVAADPRGSGETSSTGRIEGDRIHRNSSEPKLSHSGTTAVLALASDKVNTLDHEVLGEISAFVEYCEQDPGVAALAADRRRVRLLGRAECERGPEQWNELHRRPARCVERRARPRLSVARSQRSWPSTERRSPADAFLRRPSTRDSSQRKHGSASPSSRWAFRFPRGHRALAARVRALTPSICSSTRDCSTPKLRVRAALRMRGFRGMSCRRRRWPRRRSSRHSMQGRMRWRRHRHGALRSQPWRMGEPACSIETSGTNGRTIGPGAIWSSCSSRRPELGAWTFRRCGVAYSRRPWSRQRERAILARECHACC